MNIAVTSPPLKATTPAPTDAIDGAWRRLTKVGGALLRALEKSGQARARAHLLDYARSCETSHPELAKELRSACQHGPFA